LCTSSSALQAETERKDYFGLAKQPQTFAAAGLNNNHLSRVADIGRGDVPSERRSFLSRLLSRRVKAKWRFSLAALWEPIPPMRADLRGDGPVRQKWDGHGGTGGGAGTGGAPARQRLSALRTGYVCASTALTLAELVVLLLRKADMTLGAGMVGALSLSLQLATIGEVVDNAPGRSVRAGWLSAALHPLTIALLAAKSSK
jgi:hypothetical protein